MSYFIVCPNHYAHGHLNATFTDGHIESISQEQLESYLEKSK